MAGQQRRKEYLVSHTIRVKAPSKARAKVAFYDIVCGGEAAGHRWELVEDLGLQVDEYLEGVKISRGPYDWAKEVT